MTTTFNKVIFALTKVSILRSFYRNNNLSYIAIASVQNEELFSMGVFQNSTHFASDQSYKSGVYAEGPISMSIETLQVRKTDRFIKGFTKRRNQIFMHLTHLKVSERGPKKTKTFHTFL